MNRTLQLAALCLLTLACQEKIAAPAECPDLCPGSFEIVDTSLAVVLGGDSSFSGYAKAGQGSSLRVSWQFPVSEDRAVVKFVARPDSFTIGDTSYAYVLDSVALAVTLQYRDTTVKNLVLYLYRLPATLDSGFTFAEAEAAFTPANIIDSILVDDSVVTRRYQRFYSGPDLAKLDIPPADSGVLAFGVQMQAAQGTGIRIGSQSAGADAPGFTSYVSVLKPDTTLARTIPRIVRYGSYVSQTIPPLDPALLTIGGAPSARTLIRLNWPDYIRDSAQILRATLELVPVNPVPGLSGDTAFVTVTPTLADFGSKSPGVTDPAFAAFGKVTAGQTDTVHVEIQRMTRLWQGTSPLPPTIWVQLVPETSSFARPEFGSTRSAGFVPRLRLTFARNFPFEGL